MYKIIKSNIFSDMNKPCWKLAKACPQSQKLFCFGENNLLIIVNYVQYDRNPKIFHELSIKALDQKKFRKMYDKLKDDKRQILDIDFGDSPDKLRREYSGMYEGVQSKVLNTTRFDESSDLSTTYLGRTDMTRTSNVNTEESFFYIRPRVYQRKTVIESTECRILIDMGARKPYMSKTHYLRCKSLHSLPKFASKTQRIQVGNGQYVDVFSLYQ